MLSPRIFHNVIILFWLAVAAAIVQAQNSRAASAASYLERGNAWVAKGEWDRDIADYDLAIAFDGSAAIGYYNRGVARQRKGDVAGALSDYDRAIELNPQFADVRGRKAASRSKTAARASDDPPTIATAPVVFAQAEAEFS